MTLRYHAGMHAESNDAGMYSGQYRAYGWCFRWARCGRNLPREGIKLRNIIKTAAVPLQYPRASCQLYNPGTVALVKTVKTILLPVTWIQYSNVQ